MVIREPYLYHGDPYIGKMHLHFKSPLEDPHIQHIQYKNAVLPVKTSCCEGTMPLWPSYFQNRISHTGKTALLLKKRCQCNTNLMCILIHLIYKSHNAPVTIPTVHHFVTEMCTFLLQNGALWDIHPMHCGICEIGLFSVYWEEDTWPNYLDHFGPDNRGIIRYGSEDRTWEVNSHSKVWALNKMVDSLQMTFSDAFSWKKTCVFWFAFHRSLFHWHDTLWTVHYWSRFRPQEPNLQHVGIGNIFGSGNSLIPDRQQPFTWIIAHLSSTEYTETNLIQFKAKYKDFLPRICVGKCCLWNSGHFIQVSIGPFY